MTQEKQVLMVGCGNMGGALLARWIDQAGFTFTVVSPSGRPMPDGVTVAQSASELHGQTFDLVVIGVKPQMIADILPDYTNLLRDGGCYLSMAAGYSALSIQTLIGEKALIRFMPNMPVSIGKGVSALYANERATSEHRSTADHLMASTGRLIWVESEDDIDRFTAIAGSGPGYMFEIARCWVEAGQSLGFSAEDARAMVLQTIAGSIELALDSERSLDELRNGVTSKNGTTAAGLSALNEGNSLDSLLKRTVEAAYTRAVELR